QPVRARRVPQKELQNPEELIAVAVGEHPLQARDELTETVPERDRLSVVVQYVLVKEDRAPGFTEVANPRSRLLRSDLEPRVDNPPQDRAKLLRDLLEFEFRRQRRAPFCLPERHLGRSAFWSLSIPLPSFRRGWSSILNYCATALPTRFAEGSSPTAT